MSYRNVFRWQVPWRNPGSVFQQFVPPTSGDALRSLVQIHSEWGKVIERASILASTEVNRPPLSEWDLDVIYERRERTDVTKWAKTIIGENQLALAETAIINLAFVDSMIEWCKVLDGEGLEKFREFVREGPHWKRDSVHPLLELVEPWVDERENPNRNELVRGIAEEILRDAWSIPEPQPRREPNPNAPRDEEGNLLEFTEEEIALQTLLDDILLARRNWPPGTARIYRFDKLNEDSREDLIDSLTAEIDATGLAGKEALNERGEMIVELLGMLRAARGEPETR